MTSISLLLTSRRFSPPHGDPLDDQTAAASSRACRPEDAPGFTKTGGKPLGAARPNDLSSSIPASTAAPSRTAGRRRYTLFEEAMQALQRHSYSGRGRVPGPARAVSLRARAPRPVPGLPRALRPGIATAAAAPGTIEEHLTAATAALNNGDEAGAERLARSFWADDPRHDLALYFLAVIEARRGVRRCGAVVSRKSGRDLTGSRRTGPI